MRDLIISLALFALLIAAVIFNSFFVRGGVARLFEAVDAVPSIGDPDCKERIDALRESWNEFRRVARFSLCYSELNRMDCLIEELECHRQTENINDFEHAKVMMQNLLREMARLEKVSVDGVM